MDPLSRVIVIGVSGIVVATVMKIIVEGILRFAELQRRDTLPDRSVIERLERIEIAVDAVAIEVERLGEHQRFNSQLALGKSAPIPARVVTPH